MARLLVHGVAALVLLLASAASAHKPSDSYLSLAVGERQVIGRWDIALRDLEHAIGLDRDGDGAITWGEVRSRHADIAAYALARLGVESAGARCPTSSIEQLVDRHSDGAYTVLRFVADCPGPIDSLDLTYSLLWDLDALHRGLVQVQSGDLSQTSVFSPERRTWHVPLDTRNLWQQFAIYLREGVWHIWIGIDHILFLLCLLLPAAWSSSRSSRTSPLARPTTPMLPLLGDWEGKWAGAARPRKREMLWRKDERSEEAGRAGAPALIEVAKVVSAFTVAHSITLGLAVLGVIDLPARPVEAAIAASIVLAALNNVYPLVTARLWLVAFGFGLIHGIGFASALAGLALPRDALVLALLSFNLGVELGQLGLVALFFGICWALRRLEIAWPRWAAPLPAGAIAAVAALWFLERAFGVALAG